MKKIEPQRMSPACVETRRQPPGGGGTWHPHDTSVGWGHGPPPPHPGGQGRNDTHAARRRRRRRSGQSRRPAHLHKRQSAWHQTRCCPQRHHHLCAAALRRAAGPAGRAGRAGRRQSLAGHPRCAPSRPPLRSTLMTIRAHPPRWLAVHLAAWRWAVQNSEDPDLATRIDSTEARAVSDWQQNPVHPTTAAASRPARWDDRPTCSLQARRALGGCRRVGSMSAEARWRRP